MQTPMPLSCSRTIFQDYVSLDTKNRRVTFELTLCLDKSLLRQPVVFIVRFFVFPFLFAADNRPRQFSHCCNSRATMEQQVIIFGSLVGNDFKIGTPCSILLTVQHIFFFFHHILRLHRGHTGKILLQSHNLNL